MQSLQTKNINLNHKVNVGLSFFWTQSCPVFRNSEADGTRRRIYFGPWTDL